MKRISLTEDELEDIFVGRRKIFGVFSKYLKRVAIFIGLTFLFFVIINFNGLYQKLNYWYQNEYQIPSEGNNEITTVADNSTVPSIEQVKNPWQSSLKEISDNSIQISAISVTAPVLWNVNNTPDAVKQGLENGTIHINGTALPGEVGNVFITGHSSNYVWSKGKYNHVFAVLDKVSVGDLIQIKYQNKDFLYKVIESKIVLPSEVSTMAQSDDSILTLSTCTPVGTSLKRFVLTSRQIYPYPSENIQTNKNADNIKSIPKAL